MSASTTGIWLIGPNNKELYKKLLEHKDEIEKAVGCPVGWYELEKKKSAAVSAMIDGLDFEKQSNYPVLMNKAIDVVVAMQEVCLPYLQNANEGK